MIALYRVCDQADLEGLAKVEQLLVEMKGSHPGEIDSPLLPIIVNAKSGQWSDATEACRDLMDDQIRSAD